MTRILSFVTLIILIIIVILVYFLIFSEQDHNIFLIPTDDVLIPTGGREAVSSGNLEFLKSTYWVFIGIIVLLYLKIVWKLIIFGWKLRPEQEIKRKSISKSD